MVSIFILTNLYLGYEWNKAMDINIDKKFGRWHRLQIDSRDYMRKDLPGIFLGMVLGVILHILFLHL